MNSFLAKKITNEEEGETKSNYTKKKGKEFKVLDAKSGQNLCKFLLEISSYSR